MSLGKTHHHSNRSNSSDSSSSSSSSESNSNSRNRRRSLKGIPSSGNLAVYIGPERRRFVIPTRFTYEKSVYCEAFHTKESGWRECISCGKRLHCGCIASKSLFELLDNGGVECISCMKNLKYSSMQSHENQNGFATTLIKNVGEIISASIEDKIDGPSVNMGKLLQMGKNVEVDGQISLLQSLRNESNGQIKREQLPFGEVWSTCFSNSNQLPNGSCEIIKQVNAKEILDVKNADESLS